MLNSWNTKLDHETRISACSRKSPPIQPPILRTESYYIRETGQELVRQFIKFERDDLIYYIIFVNYTVRQIGLNKTIGGRS